MKSTGKKLFIRNKNRNVYLKNGKYYYRYCNEYHLIKRRVVGGFDPPPPAAPAPVPGAAAPVPGAAAATLPAAPAPPPAAPPPAAPAPVPGAAAPVPGAAAATLPAAPVPAAPAGAASASADAAVPPVPVPGAAPAAPADAADAVPAAADAAAAKVEEPKADQEDIDKFIGDKKLTYKKIQLFENVVKYYKDYLDISILDKIKNSLKFLSKYNDKINVIIDMFKHDDNGELSSEQVRMLITYLKKFIFDKIFVNYFIDIISIYYDNSRSAKKEIEDAMHMLTFVENDRKDELLYSQKINNLLERLREYGTKNANEREKYYIDFSIKLAALKDGKTDDGEEEENNGEYNDMPATKFEEVRPKVLIDLKAKFEKQELILIKIQGTFYWWDKMRTIVEKEFKETDNKYIKAFEIFINELLRETIYYDIELEEKIEEKKLEDEQLDPELYEIYRKFIRNTFIKTMKSDNINRYMIDGNLSDNDYNIILDKLDNGTRKEKEEVQEPTQKDAGFKRYFIRELDKSIKKRKDEKREIIKDLIATRQPNVNNRYVGNSVGNSVSNRASNSVSNRASNSVGNRASNSVGNRASNSVGNRASNSVSSVSAHTSSSALESAAGLFGSIGMGGGKAQAGELLKAQTEMEDEEKKLIKMKKILKDKVLKYIEILNIMATASEQKELIDSNDDNDDNDDNEGKTIVNKQSFKDMASILIVYLKQHILSFSLVYKQIIGDIKNVHAALSKEIKELEKKIAEYKSE